MGDGCDDSWWESATCSPCRLGYLFIFAPKQTIEVGAPASVTQALNLGSVRFLRNHFGEF